MQKESAHICFTVPGDPMGKERPRVVNRGSFVKTYTPAKTVQYEGYVRACWIEQTHESHIPSGHAICLRVCSYFQIPKSYTKKRRAECLSGDAWVKKKPDWDNIGKIVSDAMNGYAWDDDNHVAMAIVEKHWVEDSPHTDVEITSLEA